LPDCWEGRRSCNRNKRRFPQSIQPAALDGTNFIIGFLSGIEPTVHVGAVMKKRLRVQGNNAGPVADLADAAAAVASQRLKLVVDRAFPIDEAATAYIALTRAEPEPFAYIVTHALKLVGFLPIEPCSRLSGRV
jgi:D-arabinose 1-dehydrogenase-like Zn-dependent alcohol dehydrogenase